MNPIFGGDSIAGVLKAGVTCWNAEHAQVEVGCAGVKSPVAFEAIRCYRDVQSVLERVLLAVEWEGEGMR